MATVGEILSIYRSAAVTEREKGTYFERLSRAFLLADPVQSEQYEAVWTWVDWVAGKSLRSMKCCRGDGRGSGQTGRLPPFLDKCEIAGINRAVIQVQQRDLHIRK